MAKETEEILKKLDALEYAINTRFNKLKDVILAYLEAGSSISLATVKANLKSV